MTPIDPTSPAQDADSDRIDALVRELPGPAVPDGFADRVLAAHARAQSRRRLWVGAGAGAALMSLCAVIVVDTAARDQSGALVAVERRELALGDATVVLEPGAALEWQVDGQLGPDAIVLELARGAAFVRVQPGTALAVHTPAGTATVNGTCFFVDVTNPSPVSASGESMKPASLTPLKHATLGAIAGAVLSIVVVEGSVSVKNASGEVTARPGQAVIAPAHAAPALHASTPARAALGDDAMVTVPRAEMDALRKAASSTPDLTALVARNQALEERLKKANEELLLVDEVRKAEEGEPVKFPDNLPQRFTAPELQRSFESAMEEMGIKGGVIEVDCSEYPCVVFGQVTSREDMEAMKASSAFAPYRDDSDGTSVWSVRNKKDGVEVREAYFGVSMMPRDQKMPKADAERLDRRVRTGWERIQPKDE